MICWKLIKRRYSSSNSGNFADVCVGWGGGTNLPPHPTIQKSVNFATLLSYIFARLRRMTFKFGSFTNLKAFFSVVSTDLPLLTCPCQKLKKPSKGLFLFAKFETFFKPICLQDKASPASWLATRAGKIFSLFSQEPSDILILIYSGLNEKTKRKKTIQFHH